MLKINVFPEVIFKIGSFGITNTLLTSLVTSLGLIIIVAVFKPKFLKAFTYWILKYTDKLTGDRKLTYRIFPLAATFLIFIGFANIIALLPGFLGSFYILNGTSKIPILRSANSDLNLTVSLSLVSVIAMEYFSISRNGIAKFVARFVNFKSGTKFFVGIFEIITEVTKIISFSFRLFGNVLAGEIILLVAALFSPLFLPLPFMALEVFVGLIQAFIFYTLTVSFTANATVLTDFKEVSASYE